MSNSRYKFRAWDALSNPPRMITNGELSDDTLDYIFTSELAPMQYTGLKDKNGVEIYESDVVLLGVLPTDEEEGEEHKAQVMFSKGQFWCTHYGFPVRSWACNDACFIEVIGNIYETPELLESNND